MLILPSLAAMPVTSGAGELPPATTFDWIMLGVYLFLAVGVSFLCSLLEAGLLSVSAGYVGHLEAQGSKTGERLARMKQSIDRPLAAILTLNTIAHTVGAAGVGAQSLKIFGSNWVAATSAIVTFLILVFSEIIPKSIGAANAQKLAPFIATVVSFLTWSMAFIVIPLQWVSGLFGGGHKEALSRAEVASMAEIGLADGALDKSESRVIRNLVNLSDVLVEDVMTPRTVAFALPEDLTVREAVTEHRPFRFSRIPVFKENLDHCTGLVTRTDVLRAHADGQLDETLASLSSPIPRVSHDLDVSKLLRTLIEQNQHLALVTDEFGAAEGLVSLEDCLETLLGVEIVDETDNHPTCASWPGRWPRSGGGKRARRTPSRKPDAASRPTVSYAPRQQRARMPRATAHAGCRTDDVLRVGQAFGLPCRPQAGSVGSRERLSRLDVWILRIQWQAEGLPCGQCAARSSVRVRPPSLARFQSDSLHGLCARGADHDSRAQPMGLNLLHISIQPRVRSDTLVRRAEAETTDERR